MNVEFENESKYNAKMIADIISRVNIGNPINSLFENNIFIEKSMGYEIQKLVIEQKIKEKNEHIKGYKISLTSNETQKWFHTNEPAFGTFTNENISPGKINLDEMYEPLIEAELVFLFTDNLSIGADEIEILNKSKIIPGLEIPDSRFKNWFPNLTLGELIADNAAVGKVVLGDNIGINPQNIDLDKISVEFYKDDIYLDMGISSNVLGNPIRAVAWLTQQLALKSCNIKKGMMVSSGTFFLPKPLSKGIYKALFNNIGEVSVEVI